MTAIEPLVPMPDEPLLPATTPAFPRNRTTVAMPAVRVNLLPGEVVAARRGHRTRRLVLVALVLLVVVLTGVSLFVRSGIGDANGELQVAQAVNANLTAQQGQYSTAVQAQSEVAAATKTLADLTASDIAWATLVAAVRDALPSGVALSGVQGTGPDSGAAGSAGGAPGGTGTTATATGAAAVGTLVLTGAAQTPADVAAFVDALGKVAGLTNVVATGVVAVPGGYSFGIGAQLTPAALSHRYDSAGGH